MKDDFNYEVSDLHNQIDEADTRCLALKNELDAYKAHVNEMYEVMDALKPYNVMQRTMVMELKSKAPAQSLDRIKAQAVTDLISEYACSATVEGIATRVIYVDGAENYIKEIASQSE